MNALLVNTTLILSLLTSVLPALADDAAPQPPAHIAAAQHAVRACVDELLSGPLAAHSTDVTVRLQTKLDVTNISRQWRTAIVDLQVLHVADNRVLTKASCTVTRQAKVLALDVPRLQPAERLARNRARDTSMGSSDYVVLRRVASAETE